ncbi:MAG: DUF2334 domain-containing protein [Peptococcaceae bacterium]|nr:DUF2334 domain-containing protein [Peptococcaceae bacterium]
MKKIVILAACTVALVFSGCVDTREIGEVQGRTPPDEGGGSRKAVKPALLRLEDVGPGGPYQSDEGLHKLYAIAEYLHQEGIPFHIALIPRIVVPQKGYDVSIADDSPYAAKFVSTIKNIQKMGGIVGIHGYTHQTGRDPSAWGYEFYDPQVSPAAPNTYEYARDRIDRAISLFIKAGVTPAFWETPHYTASIKQYPAFEEQAGLLYENKHRGEVANNYKVTDYPGRGYRGFVTVPAPLGNIDRDGDVEKMIRRLDHLENDLASFFYHPFREFKYLYKEYNARGEVYYVYDQNSPLHVLIRAFKEKGYTFVSVYSLVRFVPAHRLEGFPFGEGYACLAGRFGEDGRKKILVWNRNLNQWRMYDYTASWYIPRRIKAFADRGVDFQGPAPDADAAVLAGDFNGDKKDDLLIFNPGSGTIQLAENTGDKFLAGNVMTVVQGLKPDCLLAGDFNGDGMADLAVHDRINGRIGTALSSDKGGFREVKWQSLELLKGNSLNLLAGDFNGDRRDDIAVHDTASGDWSVLLAGPAGKKFTPDGDWAKNWGTGNRWVSFASDVNGDGKCDLVLYSRAGHWQVATSDGRGFVYRGDFGPWGSSPKGVPLVADFNGDGRSDLAVIGETGDKACSLDVAQSVMDI